MQGHFAHSNPSFFFVIVLVTFLSIQNCDLMFELVKKDEKKVKYGWLSIIFWNLWVFWDYSFVRRLDSLSKSLLLFLTVFVALSFYVGRVGWMDGMWWMTCIGWDGMDGMNGMYWMGWDGLGQIEIDESYRGSFYFYSNIFNHSPFLLIEITLKL